MNSRENQGGGAKPSNRKERRDPTPSFIHNIGSTSLKGAGRPSIENAPIFEMPKSLRIWRKVRWPVYISSVLVVLLTVALITRGVVVAKKIDATIKEAHSAEVAGTIKAMQVAEDILVRLVDKQSGSEEAQAALAWQVLVQSILWGTEGWEKKAGASIEAIEGESGELAHAAQAAWSYLKGDYKRTLEVSASGISKHSDSERLKMMRILALNASGREGEARDQYLVALDSGVSYVPLLIAALTVEMERGSRLEALELAEMLLRESPANLFALLVMARVELPNWAEPEPSLKEIAALQHRFSALEPRLETAPPRLASLGLYIKARISLLTEQLDVALKSFEILAKDEMSSDVLAWYATAVRRDAGCELALALLGKFPKQQGNEVLDVRAQCLLEYHRVDTAKPVIEKLASAGAFPDRVKELRWLHAIRSGNVQQINVRIPKKIGVAEQLSAVESYFALKRVGDAAGISKLNKAMAAELPTCVRLIKAWHAKNLKRAFRVLDKSTKRTACENALMARLMRSHADPAALKEAADKVHKAAGGSLSFEVERARAVWQVDGYAKAVAILDSVRKHKLQGAPLRAELARAYIEMELPEKALKVIDRSEEPELFTLRVLATEAAGKKGEAEKLKARAVKRASDSRHPALVYWMLKDRVNAGDSAAVSAWIEDNMSDALPGEWTSEIAELGAQAMNLVEERVEAESFIQKISRKVVTYAGADESLDTLEGQLRLNFKRVGKYRNRAITVARLLTADGIKDPHLLYWQAQENIQGGSERVGLRMLRDILALDPTFKPAWKKMVEMEWLNEERIAVMKSVWPTIQIPKKQ